MISRSRRYLFSLIALSTVLLACYIIVYRTEYNTRSDSKIYLKTEYDLHFSTEEKNHLGFTELMIHRSPPNTRGLSSNTNNNTVYNANEKMLRLVNGISSNHPAPTENLWIEIDHKNTLVRMNFIFFSLYIILGYKDFFSLLAT